MAKILKGQRADGCPSFHYAYVILAVSILTVMAAMGYGRFGYTVILPSMKEGLNFNYTQMGLIASGNFIGYLLFALTGGFLTVRFGARMVVSLSLLAAGAAMIFTGFSNTFYTALIFRVITGIGSGGSFIAVMGLASSWFQGNRRGMATGLMVGGAGMGLLSTGYLVPRVSGVFEGMGWRYSWFILGGIVIIIAVSAYLFLRNHPEEKKLNPLGSIPIEKDLSGVTPGSGRDKENPLFFNFTKVCTEKYLLMLAVVYCLFGFAHITYSTYFVAYLVDGRGLEETAAGSLWALIGVISIFSGFLWGLVSDYLGREKTLGVVFLFQFVSYGVIVMAQSNPGYLFSGVLFGVTAWSVPGIMAALCGDTMGPRQASAALGFITLGPGIGQAIAPWISGILVDLTASFILPFVLASLTSLTGAALSFFLSRKNDIKYHSLQNI